MALDGVGESDLLQRGSVELQVQALDVVLVLGDGVADRLRPCRQSAADVQHIFSSRLFGFRQLLLALVQLHRLLVTRAGGQLHRAEKALFL